MSLLLLARRVRHLLRANFSVDIAAPLPASLPIDVGGPLTVVDTESKLSISSGKINFAPRGTPTSGDPRYSSPGFARACGRAGIITVTYSALGATVSRYGWAVSQSNVPLHGWAHKSGASGSLLIINSSAGIVGPFDPPANDTTYQLLVVLRTTGAFILCRQGTSGAWTLAWADNMDTTTPLYWQNWHQGNTGAQDDVSVFDLAPFDSRFASDYSLAATYDPAPNTNSRAGLADGLLECTFAYNGTVGQVRYRRVDGSNYFAVRLEADGSVSLRDVVAGSATTRGSVAGVFSSGTSYRVIVIVEGNVHRIYTQPVGGSPTLRITYTDTNNLFLTAVLVENTSQSGGTTNLVMFPRTVALRSGI